MAIGVGRDAGLGMTRTSLDCVDRCTDVEHERDRSMPQIVEADVRLS
jgi:hypothetical protein